MPVMLGVFIRVAENRASHTSHFMTSWYIISLALGSRSMGGSLVSWGWGGKSVVLSSLHLSLCVTTGSPPSPLESAGDVYVHFSRGPLVDVPHAQGGGPFCQFQ